MSALIPSTEQVSKLKKVCTGDLPTEPPLRAVSLCVFRVYIQKGVKGEITSLTKLLRKRL